MMMTTCRFIDPTVTGQPWSTGDLYKYVVIDENGNKDISFVDKLGRELVKCREEGVEGGALTRSDNYNVFDDKNRLIKIFPPSRNGAIAPHTTEVGLLYTYTYQGNDLLATKKLPDQIGTHDYVYDERDILRFYQDPKLRGEGRWRITISDDYGREQLSGFYDKLILETEDIAIPKIENSALLSLFDIDLQMTLYFEEVIIPVSQLKLISLT